MGMSNTSGLGATALGEGNSTASGVIKARGHGLKQKKKLEIDISSSPITKSWQHSKQMSFNNNDNGPSQLSLTQMTVSSVSGGPLGLIETGEVRALREPMSHTVNDEDEFIITKRFPQTMKAGQGPHDKFGNSGFNFDQ